jgi:hypothetical protein
VPLDRRKLLRVDETYELEPFHKRIERGGHWAEIWTRKGKTVGDEWIEIMAGKKEEKGTHYHYGINKDGSRRFLKGRGVLKSFTEFAVNKRTGQLLDKQESTFSGPTKDEYALHFRMDSSKVTKKVWVSEFGLVPNDQLGDTVPQR